MIYKLSELPDISTVQPKDYIIVDYAEREQTPIFWEVIFALKGHALLMDCEPIKVSLPPDELGGKVYYDTLYFEPYEERGHAPQLIGVSTDTNYTDLLKLFKHD